jgi:acetylglutamate kinase
LTDVDGVLDENNRLINTMNSQEVTDMIQAGIIKGGMFPKVKCCMKALKGGVGKAHIIDGRLKHAVLLEIFTDMGIGTEILL